MELIVESPGIELQESVRKLLDSKIDHLSKIYDQISNCLVVFRKQHAQDNRSYFVEAQMGVDKHMLFASYQAHSFEAAIQAVSDGLAHQLHKHKEERQEIW